MFELLHSRKIIEFLEDHPKQEFNAIKLQNKNIFAYPEDCGKKETKSSFS